MAEPIDDVHRDVARIVLHAIGEHQASSSRFGLAGGNALSAWGLLNRPTEDVDVALGTLDRFAEAVGAAGAALADSGYAVQEVDKFSGWEEDDDEVGLAELLAVTADGTREIQVQIGYFDLYASPVAMPGLGPVCGLDDVAGHKTVALANRMLTRDYVDVAALRARYETSRLIDLATERDPGLQVADFADAAVRLDRMKDAQLEEILARTSLTAAWVRQQFADWPRDAPPRPGPLPHGKGSLPSRRKADRPPLLATCATAWNRRFPLLIAVRACLVRPLRHDNPCHRSERRTPLPGHYPEH